MRNEFVETLLRDPSKAVGIELTLSNTLGSLIGNEVGNVDSDIDIHNKPLSMALALQTYLLAWVKIRF